MSSNWPRYAHPPVIEAVLSLGFHRLPPARLSDLRSVASTLATEFPRQTAMFDAAMSFQVGASVGSSAEKIESGLMLQSHDGTKVLRLGLQNLAVHQLRPYTNWETLEALLRELVHAIESRMELAPEALGVRYINKFDIPKSAPVENYCRTYIEISRDLPQAMTQYIFRVEQPIDDAKLVTQSQFVPADSPDKVGVILDFDFIFPIPESGSFWSLLSSARDLKNRVFNQSVTDLMKASFV